jgi:hypothetical protein
MPQGYQVAPLVCMAPHLRTILARLVPLKLVDRCCLRSADHIERTGLVRVATEARQFEIEVARVQRVTQCRRGLRWTTEVEHAEISCFTRQPIGLMRPPWLARLGTAV